MTISIVPLTPADRQRLLAVDLSAFFFDPNAYPVDIATSHFDWTRTYGATRDGSDELAGVYTSYDMAVTAPGPGDTLNVVPMAGLSWVSVHPDHRRRGVLRQMITHHFARLHEQGVALSGLHAAEVMIYGRFGYGISSLELELELERGTVFTAPSLEDAARRVTTRLIAADSDDTARVVHDLHLRCARGTLGAVSRPERMARSVFVELPLTRQGREPWQVLLAQVDGRPAGYAVFSREQKWTDWRAKGKVTVQALGAAYLGSRSIAEQADQGLITELTAGSVRMLSRAMSCEREPVGAIEF